MISTVEKIETTRIQSKWVKVEIGKIPQILYTDTGSDFTIISPKDYKDGMGKVIAADTHLRAWGSTTNLDVKGMINTTISNQLGTHTATKVYIVGGFNPAPLLGDKDAEELGFIVFNKMGRPPNNSITANNVKQVKHNTSETHCLTPKRSETA